MNILEDRFFVVGIFALLVPKNICIDTMFVTVPVLELKLWHKTLFPYFNGGHFENDLKQVVHPTVFDGIDFSFLGSYMDKLKNLVSDCPRAGGGMGDGVHGNPFWPMDWYFLSHDPLVTFNTFIIWDKKTLV